MKNRPAPMNKNRSLARRVKALVEPRVILCRMLLSEVRMLPGFIIIGARKSGTTFLYRNMLFHPNILPAYKKEVHFFDVKFDRGIQWYKAHFPTRIYKNWVAGTRIGSVITGESTPYYLFHPRVPRRLHALLPHAQLIVLLRNPIDRAYSHYQHQVRRGVETLSFEEAIEHESERQFGETEKLIDSDTYYSYNHQKFSYLSSSIYADQLRAWFELFPARQFLVLNSHEMYRDPPLVFARVCEFLGLADMRLKISTANVPKNYSKMDPTTRKRLQAFFEPHNQRLYEFLKARWTAETAWEFLPFQ